MVKTKKARPAARKSKLKSKKSAVKKPAVKKPAVKKPAVKKPAVKKPAVKKPGARGPVAQSPGLNSPIPEAWLRDEQGRELALDSLAAWVVSTLQAAQDDAAARTTLLVAIEAFYDIRESANQPRGEYAGHFFIVDAVGLGESHRPVPWQVLAETVSQERLDRFSEIFEESVRELA